MDITVEEYTSKSIIVYGSDTIQIKEELKKLGGKWIHLSKKTKKEHHPDKAWVFQSTKKVDVLKIIKKESPRVSPRKTSSPKVSPRKTSSPIFRGSPRVSPRKTPPKQLLPIVQKIKNSTECIQTTSVIHNKPFSTTQKIVLDYTTNEEFERVRSSFYSEIGQNNGQILKLKDPFGSWMKAKPLPEIKIDLSEINYSYNRFSELCRQHGFYIMNYLNENVKRDFVYIYDDPSIVVEGKETIIKFEEFVKNNNIDITEIQKLAKKIFDIFLDYEDELNFIIGSNESESEMLKIRLSLYRMNKKGLGDLFMLKYRVRDMLDLDKDDYEDIINLYDEIYKKHGEFMNIIYFYGDKIGFRPEVADFKNANKGRDGLKELCRNLRDTLWMGAYSTYMQKDENMRKLLKSTFDDWKQTMEDINNFNKQINKDIKKYEKMKEPIYEKTIKGESIIPKNFKEGMWKRKAEEDLEYLRNLKEKRERFYDTLKTKNEGYKNAAKLAEEHTYYPSSMKDIKNKKYTDIILISSAVGLLVPSTLELIFNKPQLLKKITDLVPDICKFWSREQYEASIRRGILFMKPTGYKFCFDEDVIIFMSSLSASRFKKVVKDAMLVYTGTREEYNNMLKEKYGLKVTKTDYMKVMKILMDFNQQEVKQLERKFTDIKRKQREIDYPKLTKKVVDIPRDPKLRRMPYATNYKVGNWGINARGKVMVVIELDNEKRWVSLPKKKTGRTYGDI